MFFLPAPGREGKVTLILPQATVDALRVLVAGVQAMAGPDPYYGHLCRYCGKRFVQEGQPKHEAWCIVPLADLLAVV